MTQQNYQKPVCGLIGNNGNTLSLMARTSDRLDSLGLKKIAQDMRGFIMNYAQDYNDTLMFLTEFVSPTDQLGEEEVKSNYTRWEELEQSGFTEAHLWSMNNKIYKREITEDFDSIEWDDVSHDVHQKDCYGRTPLFYASTPQKAQTIINSGGDLYETDIWGLSPMDYQSDNTELFIFYAEQLKNDGKLFDWIEGENKLDKNFGLLTNKSMDNEANQINFYNQLLILSEKMEMEKTFVLNDKTKDKILNTIANYHKQTGNNNQIYSNDNQQFENQFENTVQIGFSFRISKQEIKSVLNENEKQRVDECYHQIESRFLKEKNNNQNNDHNKMTKKPKIVL